MNDRLRLFKFSTRKSERVTLLTILLVICFSGCGTVMIGPYDERPSPTPPATIPALIEATTHPDYQVRLSALSALGRLGPAAESAIPALTVVLSDDVTDVRAAAAYVLGDIGAVAAPAATPALVRMLQTDETAAARVAAAEALGKLEDTRAVPFLAAVLYYAEDLYSEGASQSLMIDAAQSLAYLTGNHFTDSAPGPHGYRLNRDGMPVLVVEARDWWETEGRFQEWPVIEPQP